MKTHHYEVKVYNEYQSEITELLDIYGFHASENLIKNEESDIVSVEFGVPGMERKVLASYIGVFQISCPLIKYLLLRMSIRMWRIPKDKIWFKEIKL